ncbi:hypothetical protein SteCoe_23564 [Stentor coeruleus]|uniref:Vps53 N-terminal domain-containing protein n=1 Tax=Stentor coeruleus TaxID=5963 RepID=A0A1R2BJI6_9CILI|nr:hypothetical protein SteCoe_23564 [Stentor coeruleus]
MSKFDKALQALYPSTDPLDSVDFDAVSYINSIFPTEQSLTNIDTIKEGLQEESTKVARELSDLVKSQAKLSEKTHSQLKTSYSTIQELQERVKHMRQKAEDSEFMVEDICKDIRSLDCAKRNLTKTITSLKRLAMLSHAIELLAESCIAKDYRKVAALLNASNDLLVQFTDLRTSKMVGDLQKKREIIVKDLRMQLLEDFRDIQNSPPELMTEGCRVVDELGMELRQEIIKELTPHFLKSYDEVFTYGQMHSGLEFMDRRYAWLKRCFRDYTQNYQSIFPDAWQVPALIAKTFCEKTRQHVNDNLEKTHIESNIMVGALQKTLQLEQEITKKFTSYHILNSKPMKLDLGDMLGGYEDLTYSQESVKMTPIPNFTGIISQIFENYMNRYVDTEDEALKKLIDNSMNDDTHDDNNIFPSSIALFTSIKTKFDTCASFNTGKILCDLSKVFLFNLRYYHEKLSNRLPKPDKLGKSEGEELLISLIVNTSDYCKSTITEMETTIRAKLETAYDIECYQERGIFLELAGKGVQALLNLIDMKMEPHFSNMIKLDWNMEAVGDKSDYVVKLSETILKFAKNICTVMNEDYLLNFLAKVAESISSKFVANIYRCKKIGECGAQQMQLDCFELKTKFLTLNKGSSSFTSIVNRVFHKCETLIKVISSPPDRVQETFNALVENPNPGDLEKIMGLIGSKKPEAADKAKKYKII